MPKIKGWDKTVSRTSPNKQDTVAGATIARWISIYGDEISLFRNNTIEKYKKLNGDEVKQLFFVDNDFYPDQKKWGVRKGDTEYEYYSTREEAYNRCLEIIKNTYPDSMIDNDLAQRRNQGW